MWLVWLITFLVFCFERCNGDGLGPETERNTQFWIEDGQNYLFDRINTKIHNENVAKNIIIFIGDGMGLSTQMAARAYLGNENEYLSFEKFPFTGLSRTYAVNSQVSDSANTANAIFTGCKNNRGTLGVNGHVPYQNCSASLQPEHHLKSIFKWAQEKGKATGIVTNVRITHATPAATYAISADRDYESDVNTPDECDDIAKQLIFGETGKHFKVQLGGGSEKFYRNTDVVHGQNGSRMDGINLAEEWLQSKPIDEKARLVLNREELLQVNASNTDYLFGLFSSSHMKYYLEANHTLEPTLWEMTAKAIEILSKDTDGFVLLVEGGEIDFGHHNNTAHFALEETVQLSKAVEYAKANTNEDETLTIVTADHSHVFSVSGYPNRSSCIFGVAGISDKDDLPYLTLSYGNGLGYSDHINSDGTRKNPTEMNTIVPGFRFPAAVPLTSETHGGEDVGVYANGPWSHLFVGNYEQSYLFHAMMYAACLGDDSYQKPGACYRQEYKKLNRRRLHNFW